MQEPKDQSIFWINFIVNIEYIGIIRGCFM